MQKMQRENSDKLDKVHHELRFAREFNGGAQLARPAPSRPPPGEHQQQQQAIVQYQQQHVRQQYGGTSGGFVQLAGMAAGAAAFFQAQFGPSAPAGGSSSALVPMPRGAIDIVGGGRQVPPPLYNPSGSGCPWFFRKNPGNNYFRCTLCDRCDFYVRGDLDEHLGANKHKKAFNNYYDWVGYAEQQKQHEKADKFEWAY